MFHRFAAVIFCVILSALFGIGTAGAATPKGKAKRSAKPSHAAPAAPLTEKERAAAEELVRMGIFYSVQEARSKSGKQKLDEAAMLHDIPVLKLLLEAGVPAKGQNEGGSTALILACSSPPLPFSVAGLVDKSRIPDYREESVRMLLDAGADAKAADKNGKTALMFSPSAHITKMLLDAGADVNAKDKGGKTALMLSPTAEITKLLLDAGADINAKDKVGKTALMLSPTAEITKLLLDAGAEKEARDAEGNTALMQTKNAQKLQLLLDAGADVNAKDKKGLTAMGHIYTHCPTYYTPHLLSLMAKAGANQQSLSEVLLLHCKKMHQHHINNCILEMHLLSYGADPTIRDEQGFSTLDYAQNNDFDFADKTKPLRYKWKVPFEIGNHDVEERVVEQRYQLIKAATEGKRPAKLTENPATETTEDIQSTAREARAALKARWLIYDDKDIQDEDLRYTLAIAARTGDINLVRLLLAAEVPSHYDSWTAEGSPLALACIQGHTDCVQTFLEHKMDPNKTIYSPTIRRGLLSPYVIKNGSVIPLFAIRASLEIYGYIPPLLCACHAGSEACAQLLLDAGADVNAGAEGYTPLMFAADYGMESIVKRLIAAGADVNARSKAGVTALMFAAYGANSNCVRMLLEAGADVNASAPGYANMTPLMNACMAGHPETVKLLLEAGANVNAGNVNGRTALMDACTAPSCQHWISVQTPLIIKNSAAIVNMLLEAGADPNAATWRNSPQTPLLCAATYGYKESIRLLLKAGATPTKYAKELNDACQAHPAGLYYGKDSDGCAALLRAAGAK